MRKSVDSNENKGSLSCGARTAQRLGSPSPVGRGRAHRYALRHACLPEERKEEALHRPVLSTFFSLLVLPPSSLPARMCMPIASFLYDTLPLASFDSLALGLRLLSRETGEPHVPPSLSPVFFSSAPRSLSSLCPLDH